MHRFIIILVQILTAACLWAQTERIISFESTIQVLSSGGVEVTEDITVYAAGAEINHGIYRELPLSYRNAYGLKVIPRLDFDPPLLNGRETPHHTTRDGNWLRIYAGDPDQTLESGQYTYTFRYRTDITPTFDATNDELYWNVTGNNWSFPIQQVHATVILPEGGEHLWAAVYTGLRGDTNADARIYTDARGRLVFDSTRPYRIYEGMTIRAGFPKGLVKQPAAKDLRLKLIKDNLHLVLFPGVLLITLVYFVFIWIMVGRDPALGPIREEYLPPDNLSPQAMRYIRRMGYDNGVLTSALINIAVKGAIRLEEEDSTWCIVNLGKPKLLTPDEETLLSLMTGGEARFEIRRKYRTRIQSAIMAFQKKLDETYKKDNFIPNTKYFIYGLLISLAGNILSAVYCSMNGIIGEAGLFLLIWITIWTLGTAFLVKTVIGLWIQAARAGFSLTHLAGAAFLSLFSIPFIGADVMVLTFARNELPLVIPALLVAQGLLAMLFAWLLKAPTLAGRRLMDRIEGFRLFLTRQNQGAIINAPAMPAVNLPESFEKLLPWAVALDAEPEWARQFENSIAGTQTGYRPSFYSGHITQFHSGAFASGIASSLGTAIGSATTSSSGSGGSSGGGGGGGGGGGW